MRALLIATALLSGCGGGEEKAGFEPDPVESASADEARAIGEAEEMLDNRIAVPGGADETMPPEAEVGPSNETPPQD